jgi:hypothetical protein
MYVFLHTYEIGKISVTYQRRLYFGTESLLEPLLVFLRQSLNPEREKAGFAANNDMRLADAWPAPVAFQQPQKY